MLKHSRIAFYITVGLLLALGIYVIKNGDPGMGTGLIAGGIGVFTVKVIQFKRIAKMESKGKVAYDERSIYLSSKAALAAVRIYILVLAALVLTGSVFCPDWTITPWDLMGFLLAFLIFFWIGYYYYFNRLE